MNCRTLHVVFRFLLLGILSTVYQDNLRGETAVPNDGAPSTIDRSASNSSIWAGNIKMFLGGVDTNGLACGIRISRHSFHDGKPSTSSLVYLVNTSTNGFDWCWKGSKTNYIEIELIDSGGTSVRKTAEGSRYGSFLTDEQIAALLLGKKPEHLKGYIFIAPQELVGKQLDSFNLFELFLIRESGDYTLHVKIRLAQRETKEKKLRRLIIPPEVTVKIHIDQKDLAPSEK